MSAANEGFGLLTGVPGADMLDPFGAGARKKGLANANNAALAAANEYDARAGKLSYNVTPDMVNQYMSPDVAYRQNAATQALGQMYGNSGALRSSAAQAGIMSANANIAAQAWNDAFGRASGVLGNNNSLALQRAGAMRDAKQGIAANQAAAAANESGWLGTVGKTVGGIIGSIF